MKTQKMHPWKRRQPKNCPQLRFTPYAWAKLLFLRDLGDTEVGAFGVSSADDLLLVQDVRLVKQHCTAVTVQFTDEAVADFFDEQVDSSLRPEQFGRIWLHTHPGDCPQPSGTDEETFERCFSGADWAVMGILARGGETYARVRFRTGPGGQFRLPVRVDYRQPFERSEHEVWAAEYERCVFPEVLPQRRVPWLAAFRETPFDSLDFTWDGG